MTWFRRHDPKKIQKIVQRVQERVDRWETEAKAKLAAGEELKTSDFEQLAAEMKEPTEEPRTSPVLATGRPIRLGSLYPLPEKPLDGCDRAWLEEMAVRWD